MLICSFMFWFWFLINPIIGTYVYSPFAFSTKSSRCLNYSKRINWIYSLFIFTLVHFEIHERSNSTFYFFITITIATPAASCLQAVFVFFLVYKIRPIDKINTKIRPPHIVTIPLLDGFLLSLAIFATSKTRTCYIVSNTVEGCYITAKEMGIHLPSPQLACN